ncbi:hypothetical protein [Methylobacterium sp. WSM2598]|uniref:hypothetical protein n=1 Tax=Methylobacterium sp. WSM2598 TaxID=398261 RepID=UPI0003788A6E|nr:hypothetical protein [Methylobacterium sp. WSM2598]
MIAGLARTGIGRGLAVIELRGRGGAEYVLSRNNSAWLPGVYASFEAARLGADLTEAEIHVLQASAQRRSRAGAITVADIRELRDPAYRAALARPRPMTTR